MLSGHNANIVLRDANLPGLAMLLDPEALVNALSRILPGIELGAARLTYVRYKPGRKCLAGYRLTVATEVVDIHAAALLPTAGDLRRARKKPGIPGPLGRGILVLEDAAVTISVFPNDRSIPGLACLADVVSRQRCLRELIPHRRDLWEGTLETLAYRPERHYVAKLVTGGQPRAVLKVYNEIEYPLAQSKARMFQSRGPLRIAPVLGESDEHRILTMEWVAGPLLREAIAGAELDREAVALVGSALAELHSQLPIGLERGSYTAEAENLLAVTAGLGFTCPHLAQRAHDLGQRLADCLRQKRLVNRPIHGDFSAKQVLLGEHAATILDLDAAVYGDPASDLGNFIAKLQRDMLRGELSPARVGDVQESFLAGYRRAAGQPLSEQINLHCAIELLRISTRVFRHQEPDWPQRTESLLNRAETIFETAMDQDSAVQSSAYSFSPRRDSAAP